LPRRRVAVLSAAAVAVIAAAGTAIAQPATIQWYEGFKSSDPAYNPTINTGETVTWNITEGGHNIDVSGPENFKSTNGTDKSGTTYTHTFTKPGKYTFICDYHGSMHGTITVVDPPPPSGGGGSTGGGSGGGGSTGGGSGSGGTGAGSGSGSTGSGSASGSTGSGTSGGSGQTQPSGSASQPTSGATSTAPAGSAPSTAPGAVDASAPALQQVSVRRVVVRVRLSHPAQLTIRVRRVGAPRVDKHVLAAQPGVVAIRLAPWLRSGAGRYHVSIVATDTAGNVSRPLRLSLRR